MKTTSIAQLRMVTKGSNLPTSVDLRARSASGATQSKFELTHQ